MQPLGSQILAELNYCSARCLNNKNRLEGILAQSIRQCGIEVKRISSHQFHPIGVTVIAIISESHIAIHTYPEARHVSMDVFTCSPDHRKARTLLKNLAQSLKAKTTRMMLVSRGKPLKVKEKNWITAFSGYGFETRYHIKKSIVSKKLTYQKVDIIENENFGRMLFLDNELQIAERDADIFHNQVLGPVVKQKKTLEKVVILGGGDGGLLYEAIKFHPKSISVVEIEKDMPRLAQKYLRCICQQAFSQPNVQVIADDANHYLTSQNQFDAIIYDLTMHPASLSQLERKAFLNQIFGNIKKALKKDGILSLFCCPEFDEETFAVLKPVLLKRFSKVHFTKAFIPSFSENLIFASARK